MPRTEVNAVTIFGNPFIDHKTPYAWGDSMEARMARRLVRLTARRVSVLISFYTLIRTGDIGAYTDEVINRIVDNGIVVHKDQIVEVHARCLPISGNNVGDRTVIAVVPHWTSDRDTHWDLPKREHGHSSRPE